MNSLEVLNHRGLDKELRNELLTCPGCSESYNRPERLPKSLGCGHTVCEQCLKRALRATKKSTLRYLCLQCGKVMLISKKEVKDLPNNHALLVLLDKLSSNESKSCIPTIPSTPPTQIIPDVLPRSRFNFSTGDVPSCSGDCSLVVRRPPTSAGTTPTTSPVWANHDACGNGPTLGEANHLHPYHGPETTNIYPQLPSLGTQYHHRSTPAFDVRPPRPPPYNPFYCGESVSPPPSAPPVLQTSEGERRPQPRPRGKRPAPLPPRPSGSARPSGNSSSTTPPDVVADTCYTNDDASVLRKYGTLPRRSRRTRSRINSSVIDSEPPPLVAKLSGLTLTSTLGDYSDERMRPGFFKHPTEIQASNQTGDILIVDSQYMLVHVFNTSRQFVAQFRVLGIQGACFISLDKIAAGTHRGVHILDSKTGERLRELEVGSTFATVPYKTGFVASQALRLLIYSPMLVQQKEIKGTHSGFLIKRRHKFRNIRGLAVTKDDNFVVLDLGSQAIYVLDYDGAKKLEIRPWKEAACGGLKNPAALAVDRWNNVFVSDTENERVVKFFSNGKFSHAYKCSVTQVAPAPRKCSVRPYGLAVDKASTSLMVTMSGDEFAQVQMYAIL